MSNALLRGIFYFTILVQPTAKAPGPIWQATLRDNGSEKRKGISGNISLSSVTKISASPYNCSYEQRILSFLLPQPKI